MHGGDSDARRDLLESALALFAKGLVPVDLLPTANVNYRNLLGPLREDERFTAGGLMGKGTEADLRGLVKRLARRLEPRHFWSAPLPNAEHEWENPALPSGYTYLLQFIAHDLIDSAFSVSALGFRPGLSNARKMPLALEAIYGNGPDETPQVYEFDADHAAQQRQIPRKRLRIGPSRTRDRPTIACPYRDLARVRITRAKSNDPANPADDLTEVLVADPRNDDNALVSQMTVLWHLLHNRLVDLVSRAMGSGSTSVSNAYRGYLCARLGTTLIYRHIIVQDVLPRILHKRIRDRYLHYDLIEGEPKNFRINPYILLDQGEGASVEFSYGAFRFGHAMVRNSYRVSQETPLDLERAIKLTSQIDRGQFVVTNDWLVDWAFFFDLRELDGPSYGFPVPNWSRRVGPEFSGVLTNSTLFGAKHALLDDDGLQSRDLLGAAYSRIWSVPKLFERLTDHGLGGSLLGLGCDFAGGSPYHVWPGPITSWLEETGHLTADEVQRLSNDPPLPLFILFEAAHALDDQGNPILPASGGAHLGPLGSIIVAETICGTMSRRPIAFEHVGKTLRDRLRACCQELVGDAQALDPAIEINTMADLVRFTIKSGRDDG